MRTNTGQNQDTRMYERTVKITEAEDEWWKYLAYVSFSNVNCYLCITEYWLLVIRRSNNLIQVSRCSSLPSGTCWAVRPTLLRAATPYLHHSLYLCLGFTQKLPVPKLDSHSSSSADKHTSFLSDGTLDFFGKISEAMVLRCSFQDFLFLFCPGLQIS
jgi:hypothetical protein